QRRGQSGRRDLRQGARGDQRTAGSDADSLHVSHARAQGLGDRAELRRAAGAPSRTRVALAVAAGIAAALLYAGQFVISRWSFQRTLSPWDLAAVRFIVAAPLLLPIVLRHGFPTAAGIGWRRAIVLATIVGAPYTLIMYSGLTFAPAAHGALIVTGGTPVVSSALTWLWFGARPST